VIVRMVVMMVVAAPGVIVLVVLLIEKVPHAFDPPGSSPRSL